MHTQMWHICVAMKALLAGAGPADDCSSARLAGSALLLLCLSSSDFHQRSASRQAGNCRTIRKEVNVGDRCTQCRDATGSTHDGLQAAKRCSLRFTDDGRYCLQGRTGSTCAIVSVV